MIEVTAKYVDGVNFIDKVKIISWERRHGIPVQQVDYKVLKEPLVKSILKSLMLEEVDYDPCCRITYFAQRPVNDYVFKLIKWSFSVYWYLVRWLYNNARMFKQIPSGEMFSWRYFTPYTWFK